MKLSDWLAGPTPPNNKERCLTAMAVMILFFVIYISCGIWGGDIDINKLMGR